MGNYRLTKKGKRTVVALFLMIASGLILLTYYKMGLLYATVGIFTASAIGFIFEIYLGLKSMLRGKSLKERMEQTLEVDRFKETKKVESTNVLVIEEKEKEKMTDFVEPVMEKQEHKLIEPIEVDLVMENQVDMGLESNIAFNHKTKQIEEKKIEKNESVDEIDGMKSVEEKDDPLTEEEVKEPMVLESLKVVNPPVFKPFGQKSVEKVTENNEFKEFASETENKLNESVDKVNYLNLAEFLQNINLNNFDWLQHMQIKEDEERFIDLDYIIFTDRGIYAVYNLEDYEVISGSLKADLWRCYKTNEDYQNQKSVAIDRPIRNMETATEVIRKILFEFDLLLPVFGIFITSDESSLYLSDQGTQTFIKLNDLNAEINRRNKIPDVSDEMIGIIKEIFMIKDEMTREELKIQKVSNHRSYNANEIESATS